MNLTKRWLKILGLTLALASPVYAASAATASCGDCPCCPCPLC